MKIKVLWSWLAGAAILASTAPGFAGENLFGYVKGAETLPDASKELYIKMTNRDDKGQGDYQAYDLIGEYEKTR